MYIRRKVFSLRRDYPFSQRIFRKYDDDENKHIGAKVALGGAGTLGGLTAMTIPSSLNTPEILENLKKIGFRNITTGEKSYDKLSEEEKKELQKLISSSDLKSGYGVTNLSEDKKERVRELLNKADGLTEDDSNLYKKLRDKITSEDKDLFLDDRISNRYNPNNTGSFFASKEMINNPEIWEEHMKHVGGEGKTKYIFHDMENPAILGHEYGHKLIDEGKAGKLNKIAQRYGTVLNNVGNPKGLLANVGHIATPGVATAVTGFKVDDETGDVKFRKSSLLAPALATAGAFLHTHHEKLASKESLKALKELGASKEALERYKDHLIGKNSALDSYRAIRNGKIAGIGVSSAAGYGISGLRAKEKRDEIKKEKEGK